MEVELVIGYKLKLMKTVLEILKYLGPFIGVFIGWYLSQRSEKKKIQYEERKKINHTLFLLLEIKKELIPALEFDKFMRTFIDRIKDKLNINEPSIEEEKLLKEYMSVLKNKANSLRNPKGLENQFKICVNNLSQIKPILAYKINGKQGFIKFIEYWEQKTNQVIGAEDIVQTERMLQLLKSKIVKGAEIGLNDIILSVSKLTKDKKVKDDISELIQEKSDAQFEEEINDLVDTIINIE